MTIKTQIAQPINGLEVHVLGYTREMAAVDAYDNGSRDGEERGALEMAEVVHNHWHDIQFRPERIEHMMKLWRQGRT